MPHLPFLVFVILDLDGSCKHFSLACRHNVSICQQGALVGHYKAYQRKSLSSLFQCTSLFLYNLDVNGMKKIQRCPHFNKFCWSPRKQPFARDVWEKQCNIPTNWFLWHLNREIPLCQALASQWPTHLAQSLASI